MTYLINKKSVTRDDMLFFLIDNGWRSKAARNYLRSMEQDGADRSIGGSTLVVRHG